MAGQMNDLGAGKAPPGFAWDQWPDWVERALCLQPEGSPKEYFENWVRMIAEPTLSLLELNPLIRQTPRPRL
jgi:hypothetical protein